MGHTCERDERQLFLQQRHEFILAYYDMAQKDLDRHLKVGWQTITSVAGAVASISLAEQGFMPAPLAVAVGLTVSFWGLFNIIDSNYWALRAIGFLANVESVYFYEKDRAAFHPYVGSHPSYNLMDSLRYQFQAAVAVILILLSYYFLVVSEHSQNSNGFGIWVKSLNTVEAFVWTSPLLVLAGFASYSLRTWLRRLSGYRAFVKDSPGPGLVKDRAVIRGVGLNDVEAGKLATGEALQSRVLSDLTNRVRCLELHKPFILFMIWGITGLSIILAWAER